MSAEAGVERLELEGATVLCAVERTLPICRFAVTFEGGGRDDPPGGAGAHRLWAELSLRGTETLSREAFHARLERMGSSVYASVYGDMTTLRASCLSRHQAETLALVREALTRPGLRDEEFALLRDEVADGLEAERDDEESVAAIWLRRALLSGSPLARRSHGELDDVRDLTLQTLREVASNRLRQGRLIVVAAGDVNVEALAREVESWSRALERPASPPVIASAPMPPLGEPRVLLVEQEEHDQVQLRLATVGLSGRDPKLIPFWLGTTAFAGTFTSPFTREVRDTRGWSYTAHVEFSRYGSLPSAWVLHSAPHRDDAVACLELELELYRGLARGELEKDAIELARHYLLNRQPLSRASVFDLVYPLLRRELLGAGAPSSVELEAGLESATASSVRGALVETLRPERFVAVLAGSVTELEGPLRERLPEATFRVVHARDEDCTPFPR